MIIKDCPLKGDLETVSHSKTKTRKVMCSLEDIDHAIDILFGER